MNAATSIRPRPLTAPYPGAPPRRHSWKTMCDKLNRDGCERCGQTRHLSEDGSAWIVYANTESGVKMFAFDLDESWICGLLKEDVDERVAYSL